jgi:hypothetical protein
MKISKDKKYKTRLGLDVIIYKIWDEYDEIHGAAFDDNGKPIITLEWNLEGNVYKNSKNGNDLIEVLPYADFKIDDKVLVWDSQAVREEHKIKAYFAGIDKEGNPMTFFNSHTSFIEDNKSSWNYCEKYEENNDNK